MMLPDYPIQSKENYFALLAKNQLAEIENGTTRAFCS